jgi:hypothetical protein
MLQQRAPLTPESRHCCLLGSNFLLACSYILRMLEPNPLVQPNEERAKRQCLLMIVLSLIELEGLQKISSGWRNLGFSFLMPCTRSGSMDQAEEDRRGRRR